LYTNLYYHQLFSNGDYDGQWAMTIIDGLKWRASYMWEVGTNDDLECHASYMSGLMKM